MGKIFVTGDKHGDYVELEANLKRYKTTKEDVVIILGDHGSLYYEDGGSDRKKKWLNSLPTTIVCIRGNHDHRPDCPAYDHQLIDIDLPTHAGQFYVDKTYPHVLYTKEFGWYRFGSKQVFVIGGAFSVDKYRRIDKQKVGLQSFLWFSDEQLYPRERALALTQLMFAADEECCIMSHTCPFKYIPFDALMSGVNQAQVDNSTELWLNDIEDALEDKGKYKKWYCGHYHINRRIDRIHFLYEDVVLFDEVEEVQHESISE